MTTIATGTEALFRTAAAFPAMSAAMTVVAIATRPDAFAVSPQTSLLYACAEHIALGATGPFCQRFAGDAQSCMAASKAYGGTGMPMPLRDYQEEACRNALEAVRAGKRGGLIVLPTGTGKTVTFVEIARRIAQERLLGEKQTLLLVHRVELIDQAKKAFERVLGPGSVSVVSEGRKSRDLTGSVVIAGVQTLVSERMLSQLDPKAFGLVVVDETHHVIANTWRRILRHLGLVDEEGFGIKGEGKFLLGVTATPDRSDGVHLSITFPDGLLFSKPILWFVQRGYLLRPQGLLMTTSAKLSSVRVKSSGDYDEIELGQAMSDGTVLHEIVEAYEKATPGKRALFFASSVGHAHKLAEAFNEGRDTPRAYAIDGSMPSEERTRIIEGHKRGEFELLINYGILTEGYDDPGLEAICVARPTRSRSLYVQMVGRGLRTDWSHPERTTATIVDITGAILDHELDMDLAKVFGVAYTGPGLPPLDMVEMAERVQEVLNNEELREKVRRFESVGDIELVEVAMFRQQSSPLAFFLFEKLSQQFKSDISAMAWQLGMMEDCLASYISGQMPEQFREVERDFRRALEVLGLSREELMALWQESLQHGDIGDVIQTARKLQEESPSLTLHHFFRELAEEWWNRADFESEVGTQRKLVEEAAAQLRYRLWIWEQKGFDLSSIEEVFSRHPVTGTYSRQDAKQAVKSLTAEVALQPSSRDELWQHARESGMLEALQPGTGFETFLEMCHERGVYTGELIRSLARWQRVFANDQQTVQALFDAYLRMPTEQRGSLRLHLRRFIQTPDRIPRLVRDFLFSKAPREQRQEVLEAMRRDGIRIHPPEYLNPLESPEFLQYLPGDYIRLRLRQHGVEDLDFAHAVLEAECPDQLRANRFIAGVMSRHALLDWFQEALAEPPQIPGNVSRTEALKGAYPLPPRDALKTWLATRYESIGEKIDAWWRWYSSGEDMGDLFGRAQPRFVGEWKYGVVAKVISKWFLELVKKVGEELKAQDRYDAEAMSAALTSITGLTPEQVEGWKAVLVAWNLAAGVYFPDRRPQSPEEAWVSAVKKGRERWSRADTMTVRQRKIRDALAAAGFDPDAAIREMARWDPAKVSVAAKSALNRLFDPAGEGGAGFKRPR